MTILIDERIFELPYVVRMKKKSSSIYYEIIIIS